MTWKNSVIASMPTDSLGLPYIRMNGKSSYQTKVWCAHYYRTLSLYPQLF